ncbi:hypothetical protein SDC9_201500 [bioreactor metagenome]|uniref:Uncharacterized protein n=1 Tax=bioreactor metagenome TaxID=1076179 RepID=A0A645J2Z7_9ZZZZ
MYCLRRKVDMQDSDLFSNKWMNMNILLRMDMGTRCMSTGLSPTDMTMEILMRASGVILAFIAISVTIVLFIGVQP